MNFDTINPWFDYLIDNSDDFMPKKLREYPVEENKN